METGVKFIPSVLSLDPNPLGLCKIRKYLRFSLLSKPLEVIPFNHTFHCLKRAVLERVFFVKGENGFERPPQPVDFSGKLAQVKAMLGKHLPHIVPWTTQEFLDSCKGPKKVRYQRASESLSAKALTTEDAEVEVFIKYEKTDRTTKLDPVPRVISPRNPRFNLKLGKYIKKLEPLLFKSLGKLFGDHTVIKGYNAYKSASILRKKWDDFNCPVAVGLDASRFDQHVSVDALKWEHSVYKSCFHGKHREKLSKLLDMQLRNKCVGYAKDGKLKYTIEGTRMSGDMNTSLGNCVLMCSMIKAYSDHVGVRTKLANNGDDCVVFLEKRDLQRFSDGLFEWFHGMGFNMKIEDPVLVFDKIEFCQTHPIFDGSRWLMVRNPHTALSKDCVFLQPYQSVKQVTQWMGAVGLGGLRMTGGIPVFQNFYRVFCRYGRQGGNNANYLSWYYRQSLERMDRDFGPVSAEARASFWEAYDIVPDEQEVLEKGFDQLRIDHASFKRPL